MCQFGGAPWSSVARKTKCAVPGDGRNDTCRGCNLADCVVSLIRDVQVAGGIESNTSRLIQLGPGGWSSIAAETLQAISRDSCDDSCAGRNLADCVVSLIRDVQIAGGVKRNARG